MLQNVEGCKMGSIRWRKTQSKGERGHLDQPCAGSQGGQALADA